MKLNIQEIIAKKRDKQKLNKEEIEFFIKEYTNGNIADYQASALIMAIYISYNNSYIVYEVGTSLFKSGTMFLAMFIIVGTSFNYMIKERI